MSNHVLPFSSFLRQKRQELLEGSDCIPKFADLKIDGLPNLSHISTNTGSTKVYKTDCNRRARNVISSRKYRMKRKMRNLELENDNTFLQASINEAEMVQQQLNQAFRALIQHAELCDKCCNIKLCS